MSKYLALKKQYDELAAQVEEARKEEVAAVIDEIRAKVEEYGLVPDDIFGRRKGKAKAAAVAPQSTAKYRDQKTGAEWSGKGRAPAWIRDAKNRDRFLIQPNA